MDYNNQRVVGSSPTALVLKRPRYSSVGRAADTNVFTLLVSASYAS